MVRGSIWWAELPEPGKSGPGFRRPGVVIQSDRFINSHVKTVTIVSQKSFVPHLPVRKWDKTFLEIYIVLITSNLRLAQAPGNVSLLSGTAGLPKDSVINVSQLYTIDQSYLYRNRS